ncbi:hypothetical protein ACMSES_08370, partial [Bacteroides faecis]|uniref:hypothetical protein n=1 Tax=Bacteroides faecis TaxID=674529 RepID=UPI0039C2C860
PLQVEDSNVLPNESEKSIISKRKYSRTVKRKKKGCANVLTQPLPISILLNYFFFLKTTAVRAGM